jgi:hypothetical protein
MFNIAKMRSTASMPCGREQNIRSVGSETVPMHVEMNGVVRTAMDDATDVNKVVAATFAANMCSAKENKHEHYLAEYESFLSLLEARDVRAREAAAEGKVDAFTQIGR